MIDLTGSEDAPIGLTDVTVVLELAASGRTIAVDLLIRKFTRPSENEE